MRPALLLLAMLLGAPALAQPRAPAAARPDDPRALAAAVVTSLDPGKLADQVIAGQRRATVGALQQTGQTEAQASEIFDSFILPEFRARTPELVTRFQDVLLADYTVPELRALATRRDGEDWRSAQTKVGALSAHLSEAARQWAGRVGPDAFEKNRAELSKLGLQITGGPK